MVDAPPMLPVADAPVPISMKDAAILVVRARYRRHHLSRRAAELLRPKVVGIVLNAVEPWHRKRYLHPGNLHGLCCLFADRFRAAARRP
jgi:Mrp family chromosome partitioning ATPase